MSFLFFLAASSFLRLRRWSLLAGFVVQLLCILLACFVFSDHIGKIALELPQHFMSPTPSSTRSDIVFSNFTDFMLFAPIGMVLAYMGPTLSESVLKISHLLAIFESVILLIPFIVLFMLALNTLIVEKRINIVHLAAVIFLVFGMVAVHYPYGVLNPGSALRYRASFWGMLLIFSLYLYNRRRDGCEHSAIEIRTIT